MFNITVRDLDKEDSIVVNMTAEKYLLAAQSADKFTQAFSGNDFVEKLGLLEFCKALVLKEMTKPQADSGFTIKKTGGGEK